MGEFVSDILCDCGEIVSDILCGCVRYACLCFERLRLGSYLEKRSQSEDHEGQVQSFVCRKQNCAQVCQRTRRIQAHDLPEDMT